MSFWHWASASRPRWCIPCAAKSTSNGNPYDIGMTGLIGFSSGYYAMLDCDVLLMLGTDFPYRQFYPQGSGVHIAQVDIRAEQIGRRAAVDLRSWVTSGRQSTRVAAAEAENGRDPSGAGAAALCRARKGLDDLAVGTPGKRLIHPQQIAKAISDLAAEDAVFTCDVGLPTVWAARYLAMNGKRRLIGSFWHGSMANAMAQAIGAQAAFPGRQVISLSGDGGFAMLMGDFLSLVQLRLPVKVVVFNNGALGFIELEQKSTGFLDSAPNSRIRISRRWPKRSAYAGSGSKTRPKSRRHCRGTRSSRAGAGRCGRQPHRARDATFDHHGDGQRLHALHGQSRDERQGRRSDRPRAIESVALVPMRPIPPPSPPPSSLPPPPPQTARWR